MLLRLIHYFIDINKPENYLPDDLTFNQHCHVAIMLGPAILTACLQLHVHIYVGVNMGRC